MNAAVWQVAPRVWVLSGPQALWRTTPPHPADLARADGMSAWRAREFLAGRAALRQLLHIVLPGRDTAPVRRGERGEPRLAGHPDVGISVSHDGAEVAAAVAPGRWVGVDIQCPPPKAPERLLRRCLRERTEQLAGLPPPDRARELAWVWTVQEACVKAAGTGLAGRPWTIDVPIGHRRGRWHTYTWTSLRDASATPLSCAFRDLPGDEGALGAPAVASRTHLSRAVSEQPCPPVR